MARRDPDSLATILLTTRLVDAPVPALGASEFWQLRTAVPDPGVLLGTDAAGIATHLASTALDADRVAALLDRATAVALELERLTTAGIAVLTVFDDGYPPALLTDRLGPRAPAALHVAGDPALMTRELLGVVGTHEGSDDLARDAAAAAVNRGWGVITGSVRGVDRVTLTTATGADGYAVVMLADPLARVIQEPDLRRPVAAGRLCLATPFAPTARFSATNAAARAKLLHALARRTLVVAAEPNEDDDAWVGATEALDQLGLAVDVWTGPGAGSGNQTLVSRGARAVDTIDAVFDDPAPPAGDAR